MANAKKLTSGQTGGSKTGLSYLNTALQGAATKLTQELDQFVKYMGTTERKRTAHKIKTAAQEDMEKQSAIRKSLGL